MGHKNKKQRAENYLPIPTPSYNLTRFYYDLKEWIDDGCISADNEKKNPHGFDAGAGLCGNLAIISQITRNKIFLRKLRLPLAITTMIVCNGSSSPLLVRRRNYGKRPYINSLS